VLAQALMEAEVSAQIGAEHSERTLDRVRHRNGYRPRDWDTRAGTIELAIPRVRQGSYPRRKLSTGLAGGCLRRSGMVRISSYFRTL
jgi:transposase-like protein